MGPQVFGGHISNSLSFVPSPKLSRLGFSTLKASKPKLRQLYVAAQHAFVEILGNGLETKKKQIHATYSVRLPSAFHLDSGEPLPKLR